MRIWIRDLDALVPLMGSLARVCILARLLGYEVDDGDTETEPLPEQTVH